MKKKGVSLSQPTALDKAHNIVYGIEQEKVRKYGPFSESFGKIAKVASVLTGKDLEAEDIFKVLISQKLVRESYSHKEDNLVDAIGYLTGLNDLNNEKATKQKRAKTVNGKTVQSS